MRENSQEVDRRESREDNSDLIPEFSQQELQTAIYCLKGGKACDTKEIKARRPRRMRRRDERNDERHFQRYHQTRRHGPKILKSVVIKLIYKKGDEKRHENVCSKCTLSMLYKVCSTILCNGLYSKRDRFQSSDQGGCRRSYRTTM